MAECLAAIHLCRVRVTRLDTTGNPVAGPNNVYVTDKPIMLTITPSILAGEDKDLVGGCDCIIASYRGYDKLKRFDFELDLGVLEPGLMEMLLGSTAILGGSDNAPIGQWWTLNQFDCSVPAQPNLCFEGWQFGWNESGQDPVWPYIHWIWPSTSWQIDAMSLQNDFNQPKIKGYSRGNTAWGTGIFGDLPEAAEALGGFFYTTTIPNAVCGYQSQAIT